MVDNISPNNNYNNNKNPQYQQRDTATNFYYARDEEEEEEGVMIVKEYDRMLPMANVSRIMKTILPPYAKISKEAKETMQECVSEFLSFVTCEAADNCRREKRKTLNGDDVCGALMGLGFDGYGEAMSRYLFRYRELGGGGERANRNKINGGDEIREGPFSFDLIDKERI